MDESELKEVGSRVIVDTPEIRQIQALLVVLSCLPNDGKCREIFEVALACDHRQRLARLSAPGTPDPVRGHQPWLESLWARPDMDADERKLIDWQNSHENMEVAIREIRAVQDKIDGFLLLK